MFKAKPHLHDEPWNIALNKGQFLELNESPGMQNKWVLRANGANGKMVGNFKKANLPF